MLKTENPNFIPNKFISERERPYSRWFKLLLKMVDINSETSNIIGVEKVQNLVEKELLKLGFEISKISNPTGEGISANLIVGELQGTTGEYITLVCHADTVFKEKQTVSEIKSKSNKIYGPGIVDNKGGIVVALSGVTKFLNSFEKNRKYGIRFVCSPNEEKGSTGFHAVFKNFSRDSIAVLGFEPALQSGDVITSRKGNRWYNVEIKGKKAHSGREHHLGVNACSELAIQLAKLQNLTDYHKDLTVNIGKIEGGQGHNIVSDYAFGQVEVRYPCHVTQRFITSKVEASLSRNFVKCKQGKYSTEISVEVVDDCPPMATNESSLNLFRHYQRIIGQIENKSISPRNVGGSADVNHFSTPGLVILDGLGPIGGGMHTDQEFIQVDSIDTRSEALKELMIKMEEGISENEH